MQSFTLSTADKATLVYGDDSCRTTITAPLGATISVATETKAAATQSFTLSTADKVTLVYGNADAKTTIAAPLGATISVATETKANKQAANATFGILQPMADKSKLKVLEMVYKFVAADEAKSLDDDAKQNEIYLKIYGTIAQHTAGQYRTIDEFALRMQTFKKADVTKVLSKFGTY